MKVYLDDLRACPEGWVLAKNISEAKKLLLTGEVTNLSLDHDLGGSCENTCWDEQDIITRNCNAKDCQCECHLTGYDLCKWMAEMNIWPKYKPTLHTANNVGRANMQAVIERYMETK